MPPGIPAPIHVALQPIDGTRPTTGTRRRRDIAHGIRHAAAYACDSPPNATPRYRSHTIIYSFSVSRKTLNPALRYMAYAKLAFCTDSETLAKSSFFSASSIARKSRFPIPRLRNSALTDIASSGIPPATCPNPAVARHHTTPTIRPPISAHRALSTFVSRNPRNRCSARGHRRRPGTGDPHLRAQKSRRIGNLSTARIPLPAAGERCHRRTLCPAADPLLWSLSDCPAFQLSFVFMNPFRSMQSRFSASPPPNASLPFGVDGGPAFIFLWRMCPARVEICLPHMPFR